MLKDLIPNFDDEIDRLHQLAPAGFVLGFNLTYRGVEHLINEYPSVWREEYEDGNYFFGDPVAVWTATKTGATRWSEITMPDLRGILARARRFKLNYGMTVTKKILGKRSFLSLAHPDREFTDSEIAETQAKFELWVQLVLNRAALTNGELDVLRCFRDGMGQAEAALALEIAESTVKQRALKACAKLSAKSRTQAVGIAVARNYL